MTLEMTAAAEVIEPGRTAELDEIVSRAQRASAALRRLDQAQVDAIVWAMVVAGLEAAVSLAELAVEETGFGVFEDKVIKNYVATEFLHDYLKDKRTVGVIAEDAERGIEYVAEPVGVVMAITPITNPTSTVLFKAIVAAKTRNAIIFRPSPHAVASAMRTVEVLRSAGEKAGLPPGALQCIPDREHEVTHYLFRHPGIDFLWTTGGQKIVALTNAAGKPSLSVGPGNAPVYLHASADVGTAVVDILISKTFDQSLICPAEQTCVIDEEIYEPVLAEFQRLGSHLLTEEQADRLAEFVFQDGRASPDALGRPAWLLAQAIGLKVDPATKLLLAPLPSDLGTLKRHPLLSEKLMPVLAVVRASSVQHAIDACVLVTERGGLGHTAAIYAAEQSVIERYGAAIRTGRILVNAPTAVGALGGVYNSLTPTFSLGCGTWGGSSTTDNINYRNLLNVKTVSKRRVPAQWFRVSTETYFNPGAVDNLRSVSARQAVIVTDALAEGRGVVDEVRHRLAGTSVRVFAEVPVEPDEAVVRAGVEMLERSGADLIVAIGGGSVLDAAKAMRLFYENPGLSLRELTLPFLDARKRVAQYPQIAHRVRLVAVPTTAGTGSEVSPAAMISTQGAKATLVDYSLVPDMAIVDPSFSLTMPPSVTADTGIDALTHAIEAGVSIFASPYTDSFCVQAARLIFEALPRAFADGSDLEARTMMANAATIAGFAFSNAFLGVNHALAHAVGARFHIPHGRANAIFLPHVMRYNASLPSKFMPSPGYTSYVAPDKYATLGWVLFGGHTGDEQRQRLFGHVDQLLRTLKMPRSLAEAGIGEEEFQDALPELARATFTDPSLRTNPRMPMMLEILELLVAGYRGNGRGSA